MARIPLRSQTAKTALRLPFTPLGTRISSGTLFLPFFRPINPATEARRHTTAMHSSGLP